MASAAARPQVAEALIGLIRERQACPRVFRVLLRLGSFAATPAVLEVLKEAVTDPHADSAVLASAVTLLGRLNDASPAVLSALLRFCLDRDHGTTVPRRPRRPWSCWERPHRQRRYSSR